jgi:DNA polymerase-3 subunit alpha
MRIAQTLAGISLAEAGRAAQGGGQEGRGADPRRAGKFIEKAVARGYDRKVIDDIAGQIETFGRYGFNKSHSVAYSVVSYHTAVAQDALPGRVHGRAAVVADRQDGRRHQVHRGSARDGDRGARARRERVGLALHGRRRQAHPLRPGRDPQRGARCHRLAHRGAGAGPFTSLYDLCSRVDLRVCNKRVFEALVATGACDGLGGHRAQLCQALDHAINEASLRQDEAAKGQVSLFGETLRWQRRACAAPALPSVATWTESERLQREKELLGFYISGHPLEPFRTECELFTTHTVSQLGAWVPEPVTIGVVVVAIKRQISKKSGAEFARLTVEDFSGSSEVLVFPEAWSVMADQVRPDVPVLLKGGYSKRDQDVESPTFIVESVKRFAEVRAEGSLAVAIDLSRGSDLAPSVMEDVRVALEGHHGSAPIEVRWKDESGTPVRFRSRSLTVAASPVVLSDLRALLGADRVRLVRADG